VNVGWLAITVSIFAGSTYYTFAKQLAGVLSPLSLFFMSEFLTGFFVIMSYGLMPVFQELRKLSHKNYLPLFGVGLCSGTIAPLLLFPGLRMSTAVNAAIFGSTEPFFLMLFAAIFLKEKMRREHFLSAAAIMIGMLTIGLKGFSETIGVGFGDGLLILSGATFAVGGTIFRRYLKSVSPHIVLFCRTAVSVTCFFLISPFLSHTLATELHLFPLGLLPVLIGYGFISRFLSIFSFYQALDHLPVATVSVLLNIGLIPQIMLAHWILNEPIAPYHILGGGLILLGGILLERTGVHPSAKHHESHLRATT
jgi:drug/metabolite transporter (DMT)-like permease